MNIIIEHIHEGVSIDIALLHFLTAVTQGPTKIRQRLLSDALFYDFVQSQIDENPPVCAGTEADVLRLHIAVRDLEEVQLTQTLFEVPLRLIVADDARGTELHTVLDTVGVNQQIEHETVPIVRRHLQLLQSFQQRDFFDAFDESIGETAVLERSALHSVQLLSVVQFVNLGETAFKFVGDFVAFALSFAAEDGDAQTEDVILHVEQKVLGVVRRLLQFDLQRGRILPPILRCAVVQQEQLSSALPFRPLTFTQLFI